MTGRPQHILFVGIDGVRWDVLQSLATPNLDRVGAAGFCVPIQIHPSTRSISGPCWATMFTGVLPPDTRIPSNDFSAYEPERHPDVVSHAVRQRPGMASWAGADWLPLVTEDSGGPLLALGGYGSVRERGPEATPADWYDGDQQVVDRAVEALGGYDSAAGSITFVYLHAVDVAGHQLGVVEGYSEAIVESDKRLGTVLDAVEARPSYGDEDWLVIVATDHGHRPEGGHGQDSVEERTAWIAARGTEVPSGPQAADLHVEHSDVAGHIHHVLGLPIVSDAFVGKKFGARG